MPERHLGEAAPVARASPSAVSTEPTENPQAEACPTKTSSIRSEEKKIGLESM
jgi:hypothetical protein